MCPFCFSTLGLILAGTVSTGGLAALAVKLCCRKNPVVELRCHEVERSREDASPHYR
jgi:hypothetical protein